MVEGNTACGPPREGPDLQGAEGKISVEKIVAKRGVSFSTFYKVKATVEERPLEPEPERVNT